MTRLLTGTALGLLMGLTPALAQTGMPADDTNAPPAVEQPATPSEAVPLNPGEPAQPIPDGSAEAQPLPDGTSVIPNDSAEMLPETAPSHGDAMPDSSVSEAPKSIMPGEQDALESESAAIDGPKFLSKQEASDVLASDLIGQPVLNANNEAIGDVNDLVTDKDGKVVAVLIGAGGFLGLGEKDVAVSFDDLQLTRDENQNVEVIADISAETLSSAPDYERLDEQEVTVGAADDMTGEEESY